MRFFPYRGEIGQFKIKRYFTIELRKSSISVALMNKVWKYVFLFFAFGLGLQAQNVQFDANFENGRLDTAYLSNGAYRMWPVTNLHARLIGLQNQQPLFTIFDSVGFQLRSYHHMVYREEGSAQWHFFDTAYKAVTKPLIISP